MIKVGTDFSGIGAPEMALKYLGINHVSIFGCDIDKYAKESFLQLYNPKIFYDDITKRNHHEVEKLDLYVAGFPCQSFSMAGKRKGFDEARGTLFFNTAEFIKINQPDVFILENVKGLLSHEKGKTFQTIIDILSNGGGTINGQIGLDVFDDGLGYHIYYSVLNTRNYGIPHNRERVFIIGFKNFREFSWPKPIQLEKKLIDMLENDVDEKYYLKEESIKKLKINNDIINKSSKNFVKSGALRGWPRIKKDNEKRIKNLELRDDDLCNSLTCNQYDSIIVHSLQPRTSTSGKGGSGPLSKSDGTIYCLDTGNTQAIETKNKIRKLTPLECWRLQGFKDNDFNKIENVSNTQLYKQAGNSITIDVMMNIFKKIYG